MEETARRPTDVVVAEHDEMHSKLWLSRFLTLSQMGSKRPRNKLAEKTKRRDKET